MLLTPADVNAAMPMINGAKVHLSFCHHYESTFIFMLTLYNKDILPYITFALRWLI